MIFTSFAKVLDQKIMRYIWNDVPFSWAGRVNEIPMNEDGEMLDLETVLEILSR